MGRSLGTGTAFSASEDYAVESLSVALSLCSDSFPAAYSVSIRSGAIKDDSISDKPFIDWVRVRQWLVSEGYLKE